MDKIQKFLAAKTFAVAGASQDRTKYGNIVFRTLLNSGRQAYPLNPTATMIEGHVAFTSIADLPIVPDSLSIVTPPAITRQIVAQAIQAGIKYIWMQPGAEDALASSTAREAGLDLIDDGSCILVSLAIERRSRASSTS